MKKTITILAILIASLTTVKSQVSFSVPVGVSSQKAPIIGSNLQWNVGRIFIAGGFDSHVSKKIENGTLYWAKIGMAIPVNDLNTIEASTGMGQYRRSSTQKELNTGLALISALYVHQMESRPEGAIIAGITATKEFVYVSGGLRFIFGRGDNRGNGCPSAW